VNECNTIKSKKADTSSEHLQVSKNQLMFESTDE
jgi:hypothetical protein